MAKQTFTTGQVLTAAQMTSLQQTAMLGGSASAKTDSYTLVAADAGTAVTMNKATATTITVNTGLFAAGDIVTILNIGAGVCTVTAGTATVSKPTNATLALVQNAGGVLYFTATGTAIFMPFDTGAVSTGITFITRNSFSNVAGVNLDSIFTSSYESYLVIVEEIYGTALDDLQLQFRYGSTTQTASYYGGANTCNYLGTAGTTGTNNLAHLLISSEIGNSAYPSTLAFTVTRVGNASEVPMVQGTNWSAYNAIHSSFSGYTAAAQTYTGLRFTSSSGNIYGNISVYGYAKA